MRQWFRVAREGINPATRTASSGAQQCGICFRLMVMVPTRSSIASRALIARLSTTLKECLWGQSLSQRDFPGKIQDSRFGARQA